MKTTMKFLTMITLALFIGITTTSCSGDDGDTGPQGTAGNNGTDGNANVQTYTFDTSAVSGSHFSVSLSAITQDVIDNDVILTYIDPNNGFYYQTPGAGPGGSYVVRTYAEVGTIHFNFNNWDGSTYAIVAGDVVLVKVVIIESSSTTTGKMSSTPKQQIYNELENEGIDINDYYAVMDYYGLDY